jgi:FkbM family methyltransferase
VRTNRLSKLEPVVLALAVLGLGASIFFFAVRKHPALMLKIRGAAPDCAWAQVLRERDQNAAQIATQNDLLGRVAVERFDEKLDIELVGSPEGSFWIKRGETQKWDGKTLLAFLLAEHDWKARANPDNTVRPADVVLDCGAHVGVFTRRALQRGAAKVVAIEPDPVNLECLRRNFSAEIASGKVVVFPKGVWSKPAELVLTESKQNSGNNSVVADTGGEKVVIQVTTIDSLVAELQLPRVDYIKMDIEGSEREALKGAQTTLRKYRPRLMLDTYHRPDDPQVLPAILRQAVPDYRSTCGPCELRSGRLVPHVAYFQ